MMTCLDCDTTLTPENTQNYKGFDASGYAVAKSFGAIKSWFIKCDDCFERVIDSYLENIYN
jgi:hypothetical protein